MRASQQLPKTLTAGGGGRKEVMELHLQVDDVVDQPGGDQVFQQGEFAALDVHLEQIDPASAGLREDDVKGPDAHLLDRELEGRNETEDASGNQDPGRRAVQAPDPARSPLIQGIGVGHRL